jgi:hypothetical protein
MGEMADITFDRDFDDSDPNYGLECNQPTKLNHEQNIRRILTRRKTTGHIAEMPRPARKNQRTDKGTRRVGRPCVESRESAKQGGKR